VAVAGEEAQSFKYGSGWVGATSPQNTHTYFILTKIRILLLAVEETPIDGGPKKPSRMREVTEYTNPR